jgi:hypothetical protein
MVRESRFRALLPVIQCALATLFGGFGLWQRSSILSRPFFEGQTLWDTTARFHVWPWPYKFAAISNMPAVLVGLLPSWPLEAIWPGMPEYVASVPILLFVPLFWYWIGSRLDRRWRVTDKTPWIALFIFTLVCLVGAFLPIGYVSYLPYGLTVWLVAAIVVRHVSKTAPDALKTR